MAGGATGGASISPRPLFLVPRLQPAQEDFLVLALVGVVEEVLAVLSSQLVFEITAGHPPAGSRLHGRVPALGGWV